MKSSHVVLFLLSGLLFLYVLSVGFRPGREQEIAEEEAKRRSETSVRLLEGARVVSAAVDGARLVLTLSDGRVVSVCSVSRGTAGSYLDVVSIDKAPEIFP